MPRRKQTSAGSQPVRPAITRYWESTQQPLYCLLLVLPLVAVYEFAAVVHAPAIGLERQLVADRLLQWLLSWFGAGGVWLPGIVLLATLLIWHVLSRHSWQVQGWVVPLMYVESLLLTIPLFVLNRVMLQATSGTTPRGEQIVLALGAGVYEELVFRLYLITALLLLFVDVFRVPRSIAAVAVVAIAAAAFSWCHFPPLGSTPFVWKTFAMLTIAGAYLSLVFLWRGLGIATGCHAAYNLILLYW